MNKRVVSLALALALLMGGAVYAIGPSKQTGDLTSAQVVTDTGAEVAPDFAVDTKAETDFSREVFTEFADFLKDGERKIIDYFPQEVIAQVEAALPAGVRAEDLSVNEFMPLEVWNYASAYGDMTIAFDFPTQYEPGQAVIAMAGIREGMAIEWNRLPAQVNERGGVEITFPERTLEEIADSDAVLAILSENEAEAE